MNVLLTPQMSLCDVHATLKCLVPAFLLRKGHTRKRKAEPDTIGRKNAAYHHGVLSTHPVHSGCKIPG